MYLSIDLLMLSIVLDGVNVEELKKYFISRRKFSEIKKMVTIKYRLSSSICEGKYIK